MRPVDQRYVQDADLPVGDCLRACVASIFELEWAEVPHFMEIAYENGHRWAEVLDRWAIDLGVRINWLGYDEPHSEPLNWHPGYWIGMVKSRYMWLRPPPTGNHAVVVWDGKVVHDPNPRSRDVKDTYRFIGEVWFELYDPALLLRRLQEAA